MSKKITLTATICFVFASMSCISVIAQQRKFIEQKPFMHRPRVTCNPVMNGLHPVNRTYNGTNNNIYTQKAEWGATDIALYREMPAVYGTSDSRNAMNGATRPSARKISNVVIDEPVTAFNSRGLSAFNYVWGQFLDHDMSLTPGGSTEYVPVTLPVDETLFTLPIPFYRSEVRTGTGVTTPRQQSNLVTAWIDGSMVYGSDSTRAAWMRTFQHGKMKTSAGNLLPFNTVTGELSGAIDPNAPSMANDADHTVKTYVAGDVRAAEHPGLSALHTLFVREHNRICDRLWLQGLRNDEQIYQRARKEVGAIIQAITYQEFLPAVGITLSPYNGYNPNARPDIANTFATAGYRIGHTMVADDIMLFDDDCEEVEPGELDLVEAFWNTQLLQDYNVEPFLKGFAAHTQYETDTKINSVLRNMLFGNPSDPVRFGIDLGSLNIQRGRDHGLPDYNAVRAFYTGCSVNSFSQITSNTTLATALQNLYGNVNSVDLWVGILAEDHLPNKSVGRTMHAMLKAQFEKLRDGDYYFYRNDPNLSWATRYQVMTTKFSDVIERNTSLTSLQSNVFFTDSCAGGGEARTRKPVQADAVGFRIFPNPVNDVLNIEIENPEESSVIRFFTANGVLVKTIPTTSHQKNLKLDIKDFASGVYVMNVITGNSVKSFRVVKLQE